MRQQKLLWALEKTCVLDGHNNVQLQNINAKVASTLCLGGACSHIVLDPVCAKEWIVPHVVPNLKNVFGHQVAVLFRRATLWLTFLPHKDPMPQNMLEQTMTVHQPTILNLLNPIKKQLVVVAGHDATAHMDNIQNENENPQNADNQ